MGLIHSLQTWLGRKPSRAGGSCPTELDVLQYTENRLPAKARAGLDLHFAACQDCRELLAVLARFPEKEIVEQPALSSAEIQQQTARVIQLFDESERRGTTGDRVVLGPRTGWAVRYRSQLAPAAVVIFALLVGGVYLTASREPATDSARHSLAMAMKGERRSPARLSGGFDYSPNAPQTRGPDDSPEFRLNLALSQLRSAESDSAPIAARQMLARAHLAFNNFDHAQQAQAILESLRAGGVQTAEVFNDLGVAQFQLGSLDAAIASFSQALEINPAYGEALFNRALAEQRDRRYEDARRDWEQFRNSTADEGWKAEAESHLTGL